MVWEVDSGDRKRLHFASVQDFQRIRSEGRVSDELLPPLDPNEIIAAERLAS